MTFQRQKISADALKIASEQGAKTGVTAALAGTGAGITPLVGKAISSGGSPAVAAGAGGALLLDRMLSKPSIS